MPGFLAGFGAGHAGRWLRASVACSAALALLGAFLILAYQLAAERVPQHRAALEHLVRAQTGLDLRFDELGLRWGWYGPEAVFQQVELGEPGGRRVLLRAPELVVGFDAWRSAQSGHIQAGRITLVAPDIDLSVAAPASRPRAGTPAQPGTAAILQRWRGGRIDIEGGTLRVAAGGAQPLTLWIRRASLYRAEDDWSAHGLVVLPQELGTTARVAVRLHGNLSDAQSLNGTLRLDGVRLVFAGWRELMRPAPALAAALPVAGGGDVSVRADFNAGRLVAAQGAVRAGGVTFADSQAASQQLLIDRVRGDFHLVRHGAAWHADVEELEIGRPQSRGQRARAALDFDAAGDQLRAQLSVVPVESLAATLAWFAPELALERLEVSGTARDLRIDWSRARPRGARLQASVQVEDVAATPASGAFVITGLTGSIHAAENDWAVELASNDARLEFAGMPEQSLENLQLAARLHLLRSGAGWRLQSDGIDITHELGRLHLTGRYDPRARPGADDFAVQGALVDADIALLQRLLAPELMQRFGADAALMSAGRVENARFVINSKGLFRGELALKDATISTATGFNAQQLAGHIEWQGARIKATVYSGRAGPLQLESMQLAWQAGAAVPALVSGQASGELASTLAWVRARPELQSLVPEVQSLGASGEAFFDFDLKVPMDDSSPATATRPPRGRVAVMLEDATVQSGPGIPAFESVRGSLAFDGARLQRSTLTGRWLGGPVTLHVTQRMEHRQTQFAVKAQGLMDVRKLAALGTFADPAALAGRADWSADFLIEPGSLTHAANWQARFDANLTGITSHLPEPLTKAAGVAAPLHIDITGGGARAQLRVALADRLHSVFEMVAAGEDAWRVERGSVRFGGTGPVALASERAVVLSGSLARMEPSPYVSAWNRVRHDVMLPRVSGEIFVSELMSAGNVYADANLAVRRSAAGLDLQIEPLGNPKRPGT